MTTNEHRLDATLAILADASGPLTIRATHGRLAALGHTLEPSSVRRLLERLVHRGLAERMISPAGMGNLQGNRIYWPTILGRSEAQDLEASRLDGV